MFLHGEVTLSLSQALVCTLRCLQSCREFIVCHDQVVVAAAWLPQGHDLLVHLELEVLFFFSKK